MKGRYSPSQLSTFTACPLRWEFRYIRGIKSPPPVAAILGKGVDASVTAHLSAKIAGRAMSLAEAKEIAHSATAQSWQEDEPRLFPGDPDKGKLQDASLALSELHFLQVAPGIHPKEVQAERTLEPSGYDFTILGYLDVVEEGGVRDTKTKGRKPSDDSADRGSNADQLTTYDMMQGGGQSLKLDYLVNAKKERYQLTQEATPRTALDHEKLLDRYQRMHMAIEAGVFVPPLADSWQCSEKWCGYFDRCPHGARQAKLIPVSQVTKRDSQDADTRVEKFSVEW